MPRRSRRGQRRREGRTGQAAFLAEGSAVGAAQYGHLAIPATAKLYDPAVGAWMRRQR
ncbi:MULTISPECIES: helicase associated domain-containing protein [unclassified Kitasatospora]|uniref:helicase associated domain-containing protein n=1 Tax=unclassified Kitasatospora TaxID=2633591 RepID=UPI0033FFCADF